MIEFSICDDCKNQTDPIDGWRNTCTAFKDGIPIEVFFDYRKRKECANGIGFEPKEKNDE